MSHLLYELADLSEFLLLQLCDEKNSALETAACVSATSAPEERTYIMSFSVLFQDCAKALSKTRLAMSTIHAISNSMQLFSEMLCQCHVRILVGNTGLVVFGVA